MLKRLFKAYRRNRKFDAVMTEMQTKHQVGVMSKFWRDFIYEMIDDGMSHRDIILTLLINKAISESRMGSGF